MPSSRSPGITAVAIMYLAAAAYLSVLAVIRLLDPGVIPLSLAAPLLFGLELAGPYMFLLVAAVGALIGWGLLRLNNWARWIAILAAALGVFMLVPAVSGAVVYFDFLNLVRSGLGIILRVAIIWYLFQEPVRDEFR